jgi:hypothetical protein
MVACCFLLSFLLMFVAANCCWFLLLFFWGLFVGFFCRYYFSVAPLLDLFSFGFSQMFAIAVMSITLVLLCCLICRYYVYYFSVAPLLDLFSFGFAQLFANRSLLMYRGDRRTSRRINVSLERHTWSRFVLSTWLT